MKMKYVIGIDAGGTKTKAVVLNKAKDILFEADAGYGNPVIDFEIAFNHLQEVIKECLHSPFGERCKFIVAGIAGIEASQHRQTIKNELEKIFQIPVILMNDAQLAFYATLHHHDGVLTISGTGSVSIGKKGEHVAYAGGWGHLLGDEGSAYDIAIKACKQITYEADTGSPYSPLSIALMEKLQIQEAEQLKNYIYHSPKSDIASLSYVVDALANQNDEQSLSLLKTAGEHLANQTIMLINKLQLIKPYSIGYKGSMLEKNEYVQRSFITTLKEKLEDIKMIQEADAPAIGAVFVAQEKGYF